MKTLAKETGFLTFAKAGQNFTIVPGAGNTGEGWEQTQPTGGVFVNRKYFDLAGITIDDKTLFFEGAAIQEVYNPVPSPSTAGQGVLVADIMSNKQLTNSECEAIISGYGNFGLSNLTFDQTIYMRVRTFNTDIDNAAGGYMIPIADNQLGSLSPTASDRVYLTRIVTAFGGDGTFLIYPVRYIIRATAKEEAEYEYLMRLKRSYDLQNEPDRD
jgi:hypothetical protein